MDSSRDYSSYSEEERFRVVTRLGEMMVVNGGEIFRADAAMQYAAKAYGLKDFHAYTVANGIFASFRGGGEGYSARIMTAPLAPIMLCRVEELNDLSRWIASGKCSPDKADKEMDRIENMLAVPPKWQLLAGIIGAAGFTLLFDGNWIDCLGAGITGFCLQLFLQYILPHLHFPKIMSNISGALLVSTICCLLYWMGVGEHLDRLMIGPLFILTPGIAITNAIRNFMENDYLTGILRLMDALLVAGSIAVGVGVSISLCGGLIGGAF